MIPCVQKCFLLTRNSRDTGRHFEMNLFAVNETGAPVHIVINNFRPMFFVGRTTPPELTREASERKPLDLKSLGGEVVDCCYFPTFTSFAECSKRLREARYTPFESDVHPVDRFLMERSVSGGFEASGPLETCGRTITMVNPRIRGAAVSPVLKIVSVDIETNVKEGTLYSIACAGATDIVFIIGTHDPRTGVVFCADERDLLRRFLEHLRSEDPDVIIGWNVVDFDLKFIFDRCRILDIPFRAGRGNGTATVYSSRMSGRTVCRIDGRVIIDVPVFLRTYHASFEEYSLNHVASKLLGKTKEITLTGNEKIDAIDTQYASDPISFARYNLRDALLTREIFDTAGLLPDAIERCRLSGHLLDRVGGSIAAFDFLYLPRLHRAGYVAPDAPDHHDSREALPGGYVIEPEPGIYENVLVFDFRSLYPSIIMSFCIDPLGVRLQSKDRIQGPAGPPFARSPAILPGIVAELLDARIEAKRNGNQHLSQAIKILMNSFYGVLGARNCRFFSAELASAITRTGQYILRQTIEHIVSSTRCRVIYGDTDSIFVLLGKGDHGHAEETGRSLANRVTIWLEEHLSDRFGAVSHLLLQFETHFRYFLIPTVRGAEYGSKKHYCGGSCVDGELSLSFKGMESARSDWTDIAKELQQELVRRVFLGEPLDSYVLGIVSDVVSGRVDQKLVYRKRLRKTIDEYTQSVPPHVQAARLLETPPHVIRYCITVEGPQPIEKRSAPLDYGHYVDCQLQPVADSILELVGKKFSEIASGQQDLFG